MDIVISEFHAWNREKRFSGVFSIRQKKKVIFEKAYGYADYFQKRKNTINTKMGIASGTKFFTALTLLKLMEAGKHSLDDPIGEILDIDFGTINKNITIRQLLTHTSGVGDYFYEFEGEPFEDLWKKRPVNGMLEVKDFLPMFNQRPQRFPPGEGTEYCDSGFLLLGLVIEQLSGDKYQDAVRKRILEPCGLADTGFYYTDRLPQNSAHGYYFDEQLGRYRSNIFALPIVGGPDGGIFTNVQDIAEIWTRLFQGNLLSADLKEKMLHPYTAMKYEGSNVFYGLGIYIIKAEDSPIQYYIIGGDPGVEFFSIYRPEPERAITIIGNTDMNIWPLFCKISGNGRIPEND